MPSWSATSSTTSGGCSDYEQGKSVSNLCCGLCRDLCAGGRVQLGLVHLPSENRRVAMAGAAGQGWAADVLVWLACHFVTWCVRRKLDKLAAHPPRVCAALARMDGPDRDRGHLRLSVPWLLSALTGVFQQSRKPASFERM